MVSLSIGGGAHQMHIEKEHNRRVHFVTTYTEPHWWGLGEYILDVATKAHTRTILITHTHTKSRSHTMLACILIEQRDRSDDDDDYSESIMCVVVVSKPHIAAADFRGLWRGTAAVNRRNAIFTHAYISHLSWVFSVCAAAHVRLSPPWCLSVRVHLRRPIAGHLNTLFVHSSSISTQKPICARDALRRVAPSREIEMRLDRPYDARPAKTSPIHSQQSRAATLRCADGFFAKRAFSQRRAEHQFNWFARKKRCGERQRQSICSARACAAGSNRPSPISGICICYMMCICLRIRGSKNQVRFSPSVSCVMSARVECSLWWCAWMFLHR